MQKHKDNFLGMPFGTANGRLKKNILFCLAQKLNLDTCFRCFKKIKLVKDFSIDHKKAWQDVDVALFWDLENIAFSHNDCNRKASRYMTEKRKAGINIIKEKITIKYPEGKAWCGNCKTFKDKNSFSLNKSKPRGLQTSCIECRSLTRKTNHG